MNDSKSCDALSGPWAGSRDNLVIVAKMLNGSYNGSRSQPSSPTIEVIDSPDGESEVKESRWPFRLLQTHISAVLHLRNRLPSACSGPAKMCALHIICSRL